MSSKFINALIILTVAALCAAAAFQYLEMESFGLPKTLKERFFPEAQSAPADNSSVESNTEAPAAENNAENNTENTAENTTEAPAD